MERVAYAGEQFLTGSDIAHALIAYAQALSAAGEAGAVSIPIVDSRGEPGSAELLVGPASQLIATRLLTDLPDPTDAELLETLRQKTTELQARTAPVAAPYVEQAAAEGWYDADWDL
ncbi:MAG TPA: hypothetical protein VEP72_05560 [Microbacterium sp.]|nr:hypothetical protein [Microbacterium sp.]